MFTIGLIGLGLIGGSLARAIRKTELSIHLMAYSADPSETEEALSMGIIDRICKENDPDFFECDMIFLCAPVQTNIRYLPILKEIIRPDCILTDVGSVKGIMADAAKRAMAFAPDAMDINMGCPAPKVANTGAGSALMKNLPLAKEIVRAVVKASEVPVTVKFRTGWDSESICAVELAKICEGEGAAAVTVHGRTRQQMYAFPIDFDTIAQVKQAVSIPVVGNGGIRDVQSAATMFYQTGCDAIMVAQGALGKPWLFQQIAAYLNHTIVLPDPPLEQQMLYMIRHIERIVAYKGEKVGMREARKHAAWYLKGNRGAAAYRRKCGELENIEQLKQLAAEVIASQHLGEKGEKPDDDEKGKNRKEV